MQARTASASPPGVDSRSSGSRRSRTPRSASTARLVPNDGASGHAHSQRADTRTSSRLMFVVGLVAGIVALGQLTKAWVVANLADGPQSIIGETVELRLARNPGGAFSLFTGFTPLLAALVRVVQRTKDPIMIVGLSLVLGGALGNLSDRVFRTPGFLRGEVVDFIHVSAWPSFNVADSAITIGAVLLIVWGWRDRDERRTAG